MSRAEVVLFSIKDLGSGAYEAHFRALARRASEAGALMHEVALVGIRHLLSARGQAMVAEQRSAAAAISGQLVIGPCEPRFLTLRWSAHVLARSVRRICQSAHPVVHCRGYLAAYAATVARRAGLRCTILFDARGDRAAEVRTFGGETSAERVAQREAIACAEADAVTCVSNVLRERLARLHGVEADVFACAAETELFKPDPDARGEVRARLGAGERFVLGYIGSAAGWQRQDAVAALHARIRSLRPDALLLVLTPDVDSWTSLLESAGIPADSPGSPRPGASAHVRRVPHEEMPQWMAAVDATALLRDQDDINRVASPIKFGESLACGVPVLLTAGIGDASELVRERGLGAVFDDPLLSGDHDQERLSAFLDMQASDRAGLAAACRRAADELWSWREQLPRWLALHERLAESAVLTRSSR